MTIGVASQSEFALPPRSKKGQSSAKNKKPESAGISGLMIAGLSVMALFVVASAIGTVVWVTRNRAQPDQQVAQAPVADAQEPAPQEESPVPGEQRGNRRGGICRGKEVTEGKSC